MSSRVSGGAKRQYEPNFGQISFRFGGKANQH